MSASRIQCVDADFEEIGDQRRGDRRRRERRAPRLRLEAAFAATLISQISAPEAAAPHSYPAETEPRPGVLVNLVA
jgi:hypothetical protein